MQISSNLKTNATPKITSPEPTTSTDTGPDKTKDKVKDKTPPPSAPSLPPESGGGLSMAAVWASQADRRAEEKAEVEAARARTRVMPTTPNAVVDGSDAAVRLMKDSVADAAASRARADKAAEARKAEAEAAQKPDPFAPAKTDPFRSEPEAEVRPQPAPGFQAYQTTLGNEEAGSGSKLDTRF